MAQQIIRKDTSRFSSTLHVKALDDMWAFGELIEYKGGMHTFSAMHKELSDFVTTPQREASTKACNRRRLTLVSREHRKSTINTTLYTMWRLYRNPDLRIGVGCNHKRLSQSFIRELRFYFENEELQERVWNNRPHIHGRMIPLMYKGSKARDGDDTSAMDRKVVWNQDKLQIVRLHKVYKEPSVEAVSVNVSLTGSHYDIIILDDVVDWDNSSTPVKAQNVCNWAEDLEAVLTKNPEYQNITEHFGEWVGDELIINGTPYYRHDYYHYNFLGDEFAFPENTEQLEENLADKEYIAFIRNIYNNGVNGEDGYTFPEQFNDTVIKRLMKRTRKHRFEAQFLLRVTGGDGAGVLPADDVVLIAEKDIVKEPNGLILYVKNAQETIRIQLYMVVDLAGTTTKTSDNGAIAVGGKDWDGNLYVVDMKAGKLTPSQMIAEIFRLALKWNLVAVYVEKGNYQGTFAVALRESFNKEEWYKPLVVLTYYYGSSKKERITNALEPLLSNRMLHTFGWIMKKTPLGMELEFHPSESVTDDCIDVVATLSDVAKKTPSQSYAEKRRQAQQQRRIINKRYGGVRY